ncbi:MAG: SAV_2336 N-terminal domain-related protein, partial [Planktothrix sp.]
MIEELIQGFSQELNLSAEDIADTLWLALQITSDSPDSPISQNELPPEPRKLPDSPSSPHEPTSSAPASQKQESPDFPSPRKQLAEPHIPEPKQEQKAEIYARNEQQSSKTAGLSIKVPDAYALREPLALARALKPLMRRVASHQKRQNLDEVATAQLIAEKNIWIPILKPTLEPWLDLDLVVDESISMQIWRATLKEVEKLLKNYGIFRDVRVWGLMTDDPENIQIRRGIGITAKNQPPRSPKELIDPSGRRLVLLASDCVSSVWRNGTLTPLLKIWAKHGSMAIMQMLPQWMWKRTGLAQATEVRLRGLHPGDFNPTLMMESLAFWDELDEEQGVKVPVFSLEPERVLSWAQVLAGKGSVSVAGYFFDLDDIAFATESPSLYIGGNSSAKRRVQEFRVTASPMARKLAGLLASAPVITLPIVRLIQETLLPDSRQFNVAEVFLGGLLKPLSEVKAETNPDYVQYDFMQGIRELLLESVPSNYVFTVIEEISNYVAKKLGLSIEEFGAILKNPRQAEEGEITENMVAFARVTAQVLRGLGGVYVEVAESLENEIIIDEQEPPHEQTQLIQT